MKIYTRRGDDGSTALGSGARVSKDSPLPEAYGAVDEAQAVLGLVRAEAGGELAELVERSSKGRRVAPRGQSLLDNTAHALRPKINAAYERLERY